MYRSNRGYPGAGAGAGYSFAGNESIEEENALLEGELICLWYMVS